MRKKREKDINEENVTCAKTAGQEAEHSQQNDIEQEVTPASQIVRLQAEIEEARDKFLRLQAEFQNYRKRTFKDISNAKNLGLTETIQPFLQVFDHFNMAVVAAEKSDNMDAIRQGLDMIRNEYQKALDELGVVKFDAIGEPFDPELHQAVAHEPSEDIQEGKVARQWNCGYKLGEKLLRPATVVVSSGPAAIENNEITE